MLPAKPLLKWADLPYKQKLARWKGCSNIAKTLCRCNNTCQPMLLTIQQQEVQLDVCPAVFYLAKLLASSGANNRGKLKKQRTMIQIAFQKQLVIYVQMPNACCHTWRHQNNVGKANRFQKGNFFFFFSLTHLIASVLCLWYKRISLSLTGNPKQTFHLGGGNYFVQKLFLWSLICAPKTFRCPRFDLSI